MDIGNMITCTPMIAIISESACLSMMNIRDECLHCERRVGEKISRRSSTKDEQSPYKREVGGSSPSGGTKHNARKAG